MALSAGWARQSVPLTVYAIQLLLNFMWTPLFFKMHKLDLATFDILGKYTRPSQLLAVSCPPADR